MKQVIYAENRRTHASSVLAFRATTQYACAVERHAGFMRSMVLWIRGLI